MPSPSRPFPAYPLTLAAAALLGLAECASRPPPALRPAEPRAGAADCSAFTSPALTAALDERTESQARDGNRVRLLVNGGESFARRFELARDAEVILIEQELPIIPIYIYVNKGMLKAKVQGFFENVRDHHPFQYLWIEPTE